MVTDPADVLGVTSPGEAALDFAIRDQRAIADEDARQIASERDLLTGKIRFGLVVLNSGSIIAMLGLASASSTMVAALGFISSIALTSITLFIVGVIAGGICLFSHQNEMVLKAGQAKSRATYLQIAHSQIHSPKDLNRDRIKKALETMGEAQDYHSQIVEPNLWAIWAQNISAGAWLAGACCPIFASPILVPIWRAAQRLFSWFSTIV